MTGNRSTTPSPVEIPDVVNDLKSIKGIGQGIETRLNKAGIFSFAQLATSSPGQISRILSDMIGMSVEKIQEQDWIGQANQLAAEVNSDEAIKIPVNMADQQRYETFSVKLLVDEVNQVRRTNIVHVQKGTEQNWAGWDEHRLIAFVIENASLNVTPSKTTLQMSVESIPATEADVALSSAELLEATSRHKHSHHKGTLTIDEMDICEEGSLETSNIIGTDQDWSIRLAWTFSGFEHLFGNWLVKIHLESIGPGPEYVFPSNDGIRLALIDGEIRSPNEYSYDKELVFKAGEINAGIYWLVVTIAWEKHLGKPGEMMGFAEKSMLQFYKR